MSQLKPGTIIDERFELLNEVGQGGMGVVYRARQMNMERDVALKLLKTSLQDNPDKIMRFQREARFISVLDHKNIVQIYAVGTSEHGQPYIAMEYLTGRQLSEIVHAEGPLPWRLAVEYTLQVCDALEYAHQNHIIHRDIKPSNIVVTGHGTADGATVKLVDFGIAKSLVESGPALTRTEMVMGSAFYLSPGQFQGRDADTSSDIYSLGCTLFELISGAPPFVGDTIYDTVAKQATEPLPKLAGVPDDLQRLLAAMTAKDAGQRIQSPAEVKSFLLKILDGVPLQLAVASEVPPRTPAKQPSKVVIAAAAFLAVLLLGGLSIYIGGRSSSSSPNRAFVPSGGVLTTDKEEPDVVDEINRVVANGPVSSRLVERYEQLSHIYDNYELSGPALLCALQAHSYKSLMQRAPQKSFLLKWIIGSDLYQMARTDDAIKILDDLIAELKGDSNSPLMNNVLAIDLAAHRRACHFPMACARGRLLFQRIRYADNPDMNPWLVDILHVDVCAGDYDDAAKVAAVLRDKYKRLPKTDPQVLALDMYELDIADGLHKPDQAKFNRFFRNSLKAPVLRADELVYLFIRYGKETEALDAARRLADDLHNDPSRRDRLNYALDARNRCFQALKFCSRPGQIELTKIGDRLLGIYDAAKQSTQYDLRRKLPVPVDSAAHEEKELLNGNA